MCKGERIRLEDIIKDSTIILSMPQYSPSAPLMAFALRQLGATVGKNLQCAKEAAFYGPLDLISVGDDVAIQTGAYIHAARWEGQNLHVGPIRLDDGCKISMRAGVTSEVTIGKDAWIAPFTPIMSNVGPGEMWDRQVALQAEDFDCAAV